MEFKFKNRRPAVGEVKIQDEFWSPYLDSIRTVMLPYVFDKFDEIGYPINFELVAQGKKEGHRGPPFADGLLLESIRGACDFLNIAYDADLDARIDRLAASIKAASDAIEDGYFNTEIVMKRPLFRFAYHTHRFTKKYGGH